MTICVILGAGGFAQETYWHAKQSRTGTFDRFIFVDDLTGITSVQIDGMSWPVEKEWHFERYLQAGAQIGFVASVGDPRGKKTLVEKALAAGLTPLPTIVHSASLIQDSSCRIGRGGIISPACVLTTGVTLGDYVTLNVGVSIGHGSILEDYVYCAPGVAIAGNVLIKEGASLGIGSVVREKTIVAAFVTTGAQSCVVKDIVDEGITVVGIPAQPLKGDRP